MTLDIHYNESLELLAVRAGIWSSAMPAMWFKNYRVVCAIDNPLADVVKTIDIRAYYAEGEQFSRSALQVYQSAALRRLIAANHLEQYRHVPGAKKSRGTAEYPMLGGFGDVADDFENKAWLRTHFNDVVPFPPHRLVDVVDGNAEQTYQDLSSSLQSTQLVLQVPESSGGSGTYFADSEADFLTITSQLGTVQQLVVSQKVLGAKERSVQVCIAATDVYVSPAQAQLVGHALLTADIPGSGQFCGGCIVPGLMQDATYVTAKRIATTLATALRERGYRGIFGIDFLVAEDGTLYILEVNARTTGLTSLLGSIQRNLPYQIMHLLELAREPYSVTPDVREQYGSGSCVVVYAQANGYLDIQTAVYDAQGHKTGDGLESGSYVPDAETDYFVALRVSPREWVKAGTKIAYIYSKTRMFDDTKTLSPGVQQLLTHIRDRFVAKEQGE